MLIVAGPGAGKTKTLIHRIAWLLAQDLAQPQQVLAVTFSVRAASELRLRLAELLGEHVAAQVSAATFHTICARLLREHPQLVGREVDWTVYDQIEVRKVVDWVLSDRQRTAIQQGLADFGQPASSEVLHEISLAKSRLLTPDSYEQAARHPAGPLIAAVWRETETELRRSNAMDFDDLLVNAVRLLAEHPHYLELYRHRWPWILVDEYQDTCQAQALLAALLTGPNGNLAVVGDDDQAGARSVRIRKTHDLGSEPSFGRIVLKRSSRTYSVVPVQTGIGCPCLRGRTTGSSSKTPRSLRSSSPILSCLCSRYGAGGIARPRCSDWTLGFRCARAGAARRHASHPEPRYRIAARGAASPTACAGTHGVREFHHASTLA